MINYQFFPRSRGVTTEIQQIIDCFKTVDGERDSKLHLVYNDMLVLLRPHLESVGFRVEQGKKNEDRFSGVIW